MQCGRSDLETVAEVEGLGISGFGGGGLQRLLDPAWVWIGHRKLAVCRVGPANWLWLFPSQNIMSLDGQSPD